MKKVLYLGTDPQKFASEKTDYALTHYPIIQIHPRALDTDQIKEAYADLDRYTHFIFTSKNAVSIFFDHLKMRVDTRPCIAVGVVTASHLEQRGADHVIVAKEETQEGVIALLKGLDLTQAYIFMPHSSLSRPALLQFLHQEGIAHRACPIYDTVIQSIEPRPNVTEYDLIVFTSPSTVDGFISLFGALPPLERCYAIGPITGDYMQKNQN